MLVASEIVGCRHGWMDHNHKGWIVRQEFEPWQFQWIVWNGPIKYYLSSWVSHQLSWLAETQRARYMSKHSTLAKCFRDWDNNILANCQPRPRQSWVGIPSEMLTAQRRVVDQQKGYYVGLITFFSLFIVLVVVISDLIKYALIKREGLSREKNWVSKILKIYCWNLYLKSLVPRFKNDSLGDPCLMLWK